MKVMTTGRGPRKTNRNLPAMQRVYLPFRNSLRKPIWSDHRDPFIEKIFLFENKNIFFEYSFLFEIFRIVKLK